MLWFLTCLGGNILNILDSYPPPQHQRFALAGQSECCKQSKPKKTSEAVNGFGALCCYYHHHVSSFLTWQKWGSKKRRYFLSLPAPASQCRTTKLFQFVSLVKPTRQKKSVLQAKVEINVHVLLFFFKVCLVFHCKAVQANQGKPLMVMVMVFYRSRGILHLHKSPGCFWRKK